MDTAAEIAEWRYVLAGEIMGAGGSGKDLAPAVAAAPMQAAVVSTGIFRQQVGSDAVNEKRSDSEE